MENSFIVGFSCRLYSSPHAISIHKSVNCASLFFITHPAKHSAFWQERICAPAQIGWATFKAIGVLLVITQDLIFDLEFLFKDFNFFHVCFYFLLQSVYLFPLTSSSHHTRSSFAGSEIQIIDISHSYST